MSNEPSGAQPRPTMPIRRELVVLLALAAVVTALILSVIDVSKVASTSMVSTLQPGDRVVINRLSGWLSMSPQRGEIIVFHDPGGWLSAREEASYGDELIKRVVAVGGDTVSCCNSQGQLLVNGVAARP